MDLIRRGRVSSASAALDGGKVRVALCGLVRHWCVALFLLCRCPKNYAIGSSLGGDVLCSVNVVCPALAWEPGYNRRDPQEGGDGDEGGWSGVEEEEDGPSSLTLLDAP